MPNSFPKHKQHTFFIPGACGKIEALSSWPQPLETQDPLSGPVTDHLSSPTTDPVTLQVEPTPGSDTDSAAGPGSNTGPGSNAGPSSDIGPGSDTGPGSSTGSDSTTSHTSRDPSPIKLKQQDTLPPRVALICHPHPLFQGSMHNKVVTTLAKAYASLGIASLRFNFRGVGKSDGSYGHIDGEVEDAVAAMQFINNTLPQHQLLLAGFSFGSYVAAQLASQYPCQSLISIAPPVGHMPFAQLSHITCPWLVVQGGQDDIVSKQEVEAWYQSQPTTQHMALKIMPQAGHFFHARLLDLQHIIVEFISQQQALKH